MDKKIFVTEPTLPSIDDFIVLLNDIWESKQITNVGKYHQKLEKELAEYLEVNYISLFSNGTLALITALQVMRIVGEVITTPFSFVATTHSLWWNGIKPVFVDIEDVFYNMDYRKIEAAITPKTQAILPVHVYGNPCNVTEIKKIADTYGLKVIYDAAHAFGVCQKGKSILNMGDLSILSFHATKVFNTIEGGAIVCHDEEMKKRIDYLRNFGFADEITVVAPGINAKMNEIQAAFGLLQLKTVTHDIKKRQTISNKYRELLKEVKGISCINDIEDVQHNYSYFPILINEAVYKLKRDELFELLKSNNIFCRRYFFPLISNMPTYRGLDSAKASHLPVANYISDRILCLPIYTNLTEYYIFKIIDIIKKYD